MPETDKRKLVAKLEARLRGWEIDDSFQFIVWPHGNYLLKTGGPYYELTPHDTDAGRLEWMELLGMNVVASRLRAGEIGCWAAGPPSMTYSEAATPGEAITLAVEAAAEQEAQGGS